MRDCIRFCALSALGLSACVAPGEPGTGVSSSALTPAPGAVAALLALADAASPGGATITVSEATAYAAEVPAFGGDESVDALGILGRFQDATSYPQLPIIAAALRHHVGGLRISGMTVTGLTISGCGGAVTASFDPAGANYAGVSLVYSGDAWSTAHATPLTLGAGGSYQATLAGVTAAQSLDFAVALAQPNGDTLWLNNPRENRPGSIGHVDYRQALSLCEAVATPTAPPFARLLRAFALPDSDGGAAVTSSEFDWMVAQATWEGGPGVDDADVIDPAVAALDAMQASGIDFGGNYPGMRGFLEQMRMRVAAAPVLPLQRNAVNQYVFVTAPQGAQWMRVYYSTDGWNNPKVVECTPTGRAGYVTCGLGFLPPNALVSYSAIFSDGSETSGVRQYVHAADGGNAFQKAR